MMTALGRDGHQPCVLSRWDNTPRSGCRGLVINDVTPDAFREHVRYAAGKAAQFPAGERLLWLKSWNEWAEGNTMEPDQQFGHGFLDALRDGLAAPALTVGPQMPDWEHLPGRRPADVARLAREQGASPAEPKPAPAAGPSAGTAAGDDSLTRSAP
jgi:hypothetical protein